METEELEMALDELEVRLERLRALYEQYFLGIEKLEPQVARKDVDRRIFVLRREKIRNTGRRFKLQTLIQRYNTFQQYWQRICREIENGTYRRHVIRAEKTVGPSALLTVAARRRFGKERAKSDQPPAEPQFAEPVADEVTHPLARAATLAASDEAAGDDSLGRPRSRVPTLPGLSSAPPPPLPGSPLAPPPAAFARTAAPAVPTQPTRGAVPPPAAPSATRSSRAPKPPKPFESLELDMDFMGDWDPGTSGRGRAPLPNNARPPVELKASEPKAEPAAQPARRLAPPPKPARAPSPDASHPEPSRAEPAARAPVAASPPTAPKPPAVAPAALKPAVAAPVATKPAVTSPTAPKPAVVAPVATKPVATTAPAQAPAAPKSAPAASPSPTAATGQAPIKPAQPQKPAKPQKPADAAGGDSKMKELHQRFVEASKSAGQPAVSYEGLSKSLRAAEAKLREKHGNRRIDFEVVLKDGKPVVKPVVR